VEQASPLAEPDVGARVNNTKAECTRETAPEERPSRGRTEDRRRGDHRRRRGRRRGGYPPDILYHATSVDRIENALETGFVEVRGDRPVFLSRHEGQAWHVAHRSTDRPAVLYVDVSRARRDGCFFERNSQGLWQTRSIPIRHVLNLANGFGEQVSAGGIPVWWGPTGPELALIRVQRRSGTSWEVAKGKLEPGESPETAAVREVREEMGCPEFPLEITQRLGFIRYGFHTPDGQPRLKTLHMYLMDTPEQERNFSPSRREGILEVDWFDPVEAARICNHRSLRPLMRTLRDTLVREWAERD
jgi:8-oxo-dGTP pyrophosphatase MutT (NUDIX family)